MGLLLPQQEPARATTFDAGRQQSLPPFHGTIHNSQAFAHRRNKTMCARMFTRQVFCVYAEVVGICW